MLSFPLWALLSYFHIDVSQSVGVGLCECFERIETHCLLM